MKIKNLAIGIAIIILTFLTVFAGIQTFYPNPKFDDFCGDIRPKQIAEPEREPIACTEDAKQCPDGTFVSRDPNNNCKFFPCENEFENCNQEYQSARNSHSKNLFIITLILGILLLATGGALFSLEAVGAGIMGGGIITIIYGAGSYWPNASNLFRFIISLVGLVIVIGLAYWLNKKTQKK